MLKKAAIVVLFIMFLSSTFPLHQTMGQPETTVSVQPEKTSGLNQGDTFSTNITVSNVTNLYAWQFYLYYQSSVINGTYVNEGPFLKAENVSTYFFVSNFTDNYNATHGLIYVSCTRIGHMTGANGSGALATVTFKAISAGASVLHLDTVKLLDSAEPYGNLIPFTLVDNEVTVVSEFPSPAILPLVMIATLVSLVAFRRRKVPGAKPKL
jgi:hypothetical protein